MHKKRISRIHYITQDMPHSSHQQLALEACKAGVDLVQLRLKNRAYTEMRTIATEIKAICQHFDATFIINDHLDLALELDVDGVHLGNSDMDHELARKALGPDKIIGGTAYTLEEAVVHQSKGLVDYMGLGTFRRTRTKPEIQEFLSLHAIGQLVEQLKRMEGPDIPILVIGGIRLEDISPLLSVGTYGIALASMINESANKLQTYTSIVKTFAQHLNTHDNL